jgi:hypothetical protein
MTTYRIITSAGELDTQGFDAALNFVFEDLSDYSERLTNYSQQITLPDTEPNRRIFGHWGDFNITSEFDPNKALACEVVADGVTVFDGVLKLDAVSREGATLSYLVTIQSIDRVFADSLRDVNTADLEWSEYNHVRTLDAITSTWNAPLGEGYVYPKIQYGAYDNAATTYTWQWNPAFYAKTIWDKIFAKAGFTYTSDFLNSEYFRRIFLPYTKENIEMTQDQIDTISTRVGVTPDLPAAQSGSIFTPQFKAANDGAIVGQWLYKQGLPLTAQTGSDFADPSNQYQIDKFVAAKAGYYDIDFRANLGFKYFNNLYNTFYLDSGDLQYHYEMILSRAAGGAVLLADSGREQTNPYGIVSFFPADNRTSNSIYMDEGQEINLSATAVWLEPGDEIRMDFSFKHPEDNVWKDSGGGIGGIVVQVWPIVQRVGMGVQTTFSATPSGNTLLSDFEIGMDQVAPSMDAITFVSDIVKRFNLTFIPNPDIENDIILEPIDTWLNTRRDIVDWSEKLDHTQYEIRPTANEVAQTYVYRDTEDGDYFNAKYQNTANKVYGEQRVVTTNEFNTEETVIETQFAPTPVASAFEATQFVQPWFADIQTVTDTGTPENVESLSVKPRLLFYGGLIATDQFTIAETITGTANPFTAYPYCGHWDHPTNPRWDLNWGMPDIRYWDSATTAIKTVYNQFHRNSVLNRVSPDSRVLEGRFALTAADVKALDPRTRIHIDGALWRVLRVDNWTTPQDLTQVTLIKVLDISESVRTSFATPNTYAACPADLVAKKATNNNYYYYASTSGQRVTEQCCDYLGGNWQNGVCVVPNVSPPKPSRPGTTPAKPSTIQLNRNLLTAQRGGISQKTSVSTRGAGNIVGGKALNTSLAGNSNIINTAENVSVLGNFNTMYSTFDTFIVGDSNTVEDKTSFLPGQSTQAVIFGNSNTVTPGLGEVTIIGSNITADTSSTTYIKNLKMSGLVESSTIIYATASYALNSLAGTAVSASYADKALHAENILMYVQNNSGATIPKGKVVIISGSVGDNPLVRLADYTTERMSAYTVGFTYEDIANGGQGRILTEGRLVGIDTTGYTGGDLLYLGASGSFTKVEPQAPNHTVRLGQILRVQQNNGVIDVRIDNGYEIDELHDVRIANPTNGQSLIRSGSVWINGTASMATSASYVTPYETAWTSYVPAWTSDATAPALNNGTIQGAYKLIGKTCHVRVKLDWGTTTTGGSGAWYFSLPLSASSAYGLQMPCSIMNDGIAWYQGTVNGVYGNFTNRVAIIAQNSGANTSGAVTTTHPFTFGRGDGLQFAGSYEIA